MILNALPGEVDQSNDHNDSMTADDHTEDIQPSMPAPRAARAQNGADAEFPMQAGNMQKQR